MGIIYWSYGSGLANRLRALVGYMAMSQVLEEPFYLCWVPDVYCDAEFTDLFVAPSTMQLITQSQKNEMESKPEPSIYTANVWFYEIWKAYLSGVIDPNEFCRLANAHLMALLPVSSIADAVNDFSRKYSVQTLAGIHIRLTDNVSQFKIWGEKSPHFKPEKISKIEGFECFIRDSSQPDGYSQVFLATDNQDVENRIKASFPDQIITYPKRFRSDRKRKFLWQQLKFEGQLQRTSSIEEALIELLILSGQWKVFGS